MAKLPIRAGEIIKRFTLDGGELLEKIPRPQRSGLVAVLMFAMLWIDLPLGAPGSWCQLLPWGCPAQQPEEKADIAEEPKQEVTPLTFWLEDGQGASGDLCHLDYVYQDNAKFLSPLVLHGRFAIPRKDVNSPFALAFVYMFTFSDDAGYRWQESRRWHCPEAKSLT